MRTCTKCQCQKPLDSFPPDKRSSDGRQARCRECINAWMKDHYRKDPAWSMLRRARGRAAKKGWDFDLEIEDLSPLPTHCPVLGVPLRISTEPHDPFAYSLDRKDNAKGYVKGNVIVMSMRANRLKNDGTLAEFEALVRWLKPQEPQISAGSHRQCG